MSVNWLPPETAEQLRQDLQPAMKAALMQTWREGARDGLQMAAKMTNSVIAEVTAHKNQADTETALEALQAQHVVLLGLHNALVRAADETMKEL